MTFIFWFDQIYKIRLFKNVGTPALPPAKVVLQRLLTSTEVYYSNLACVQLPQES